MNTIDTYHPLRETMIVDGNQVAISSDHFTDSGVAIFQTREKLRQFRCRDVCLYEKNVSIDSVSSIREITRDRDFLKESLCQPEAVKRVVEVSGYTLATTNYNVIEEGSSNHHEEEEGDHAKREKAQERENLKRFLRESPCRPEPVQKAVKVSNYPFGSVSLIPSGSYQFAKKLQRLKTANFDESNIALQRDDSQIQANVDDLSTSDMSETLENVMDESIKEMETKPVSIPIIPGLIIMEIVGSYVNNRMVWNSLASLNRETFEISKNLTQLYRPWPSKRWRATSITAQKFPTKGKFQGQRRRRRIARGAVQTSARPRTVAFGTDCLCYGTDRGNVIVRWVHGDGSTKVLEGHMGCVNSVQCYGNLLFSAGDDLETRIWNVTTMSCEAILKGHVGSITSIAILPFDLCHVKSQRHGNCNSLNPLIFLSTSCMLVATAGLDGDIHLYAVYCKGDKVVFTEHFATFMDEFHSKPVHSVVLYEKDGRRSLISGGNDSRLRLWDVDAAIVDGIGRCSNGTEAESDSKGCATKICRSTCIYRYDGEIKSIALSPDKERIAVAFGRTICHSNLTGKTLQNYNFLNQDHNHLRRRRQRRLREEGSNNPEGVVRNETIANDDKNHWEVLKGHSGDIRCLDFSSDGSTVASACTDGSIRLWMLGERTWKRKWKAHNGFMVCSLAVSPDGQSLLSAGSDGTLAIEDL